MRDSKHIIIIMMQWVVIAVLVFGGGTAILMAEYKAAEYKTKLKIQQSNIDSLREQLRQAKKPVINPPQPLPEAVSNTAPGPSPAAPTPRVLRD